MGYPLGLPEWKPAHHRIETENKRITFHVGAFRVPIFAANAGRMFLRR